LLAEVSRTIFDSAAASAVRSISGDERMEIPFPME
jgi:hypothetical protein